jgi:hypothetical protein
MSKVKCPHCQRVRNQRVKNSQCPCGWVKPTLLVRIQRAIAAFNGKEYQPRRTKQDKANNYADSFGGYDSYGNVDTIVKAEDIRFP